MQKLGSRGRSINPYDPFLGIGTAVTRNCARRPTRPSIRRQALLTRAGDPHVHDQ